jgi:EmrB/QacA subfamily drug resistance transporter
MSRADELHLGSTSALKGELRVVLVGLMLVMGLAAMDQNVVNTALPRITADLGGVAHLSWVVTAFLLTATISTPLYGKLSDMYGRRRMMVISISVFLLASILCGLSRSMLQLIGFRALQGLGAGGLMTLSQTIIGDLVTPRERGRYQGLFTGVFAISSVAGPLIGGALTTALSWRWVFYVNLPLGGMALVLILLGLHGSKARRRHVVDYPGAALLTAGTSSLLLLLSWGLSEGSDLARLVLAVGALGAGLLFLRQEARAAEPILSLAMFANRTFAVGATATSIMAFAMMGALVFLPLYLQLVLGQSPIQAGLIVTPQIVGMLLSSIVGGRAVSALGRVKPFLVSGVLLEAASLAGLAVGAGWAFPPWFFSIVVFTLGLGMGIGMPNAVTAVQNAVDRRDMGIATGAMAFVRALGGAVGVALSGGVVAFVLKLALGHQFSNAQLHALIQDGARLMSGVASHPHAPLLQAYRHAIETSFWVSAVMMAAALALVCTLPNDDLRGPEAADPASTGGAPAATPDRRLRGEFV